MPYFSLFRRLSTAFILLRWFARPTEHGLQLQGYRQLMDAADSVNVSHCRWIIPSVDTIGIEVTARLACLKLSCVVSHLYHSLFSSAMSIDVTDSLNRQPSEFEGFIGYRRHELCNNSSWRRSSCCTI